MKTITQTELIKLLKEADGKSASFIKLTTNTDARLKKTGNPFQNVRKFSRVFGIINYNYENSVNAQRNREGKNETFEAKERAYGVRDDEYNGCLLFHNNKTYLTIKIESIRVKPKYVEIKDDKARIIPKSLVKPFLPTVSKSARQDVKKEVVHRNYLLDSIRTISFKGKKYKVV